MAKIRKLKFGPKGHPLQRVKEGNENGQTRHRAPRFERGGKLLSPPRSRKNPAKVGWATLA